MCRLFWAPEPIPYITHEVLLKYLKDLKSESGGDGYGIYYPYKQTGPMRFRSTEKEIDEEIVFENQTMLFHSRQGTHGIKAIRNTHPFKIGKWMMAHNGTCGYDCEKWRKSLVLHRIFPKGECDSEILGMMLARIHPTNVFRWDDAPTWGNLFCWDKKTKRMYLIVTGRWEMYAIRYAWQDESEHFIYATHFTSSFVKELAKYSEVYISRVPIGVYEAKDLKLRAIYISGKVQWERWDEKKRVTTAITNTSTGTSSGLRALFDTTAKDAVRLVGHMTAFWGSKTNG